MMQQNNTIAQEHINMTQEQGKKMMSQFKDMISQQDLISHQNNSLIKEQETNTNIQKIQNEINKKSIEEIAKETTKVFDTITIIMKNYNNETDSINKDPKIESMKEELDKLQSELKEEGVKSVKEILLINAGSGYTVPPTITLTGGGVGASATCSIETVRNGIISFTMTNVGSGYKNKPLITITGSVGTGETAVGIASLGTNNQVAAIRISNPGAGYASQPTVSIAPPPSLAGFGTYIFNEIVVGSISGTQARVKSWDYDTKILKISFANIGSNHFGFYPGELIVGSASSATYAISSVNEWDLYDKYGENKIIQDESDQIIDFSQTNPFGNF
jgi:hypothetical protein